jgi:hypothetical protein
MGSTRGMPVNRASHPGPPASTGSPARQNTPDDQTRQDFGSTCQVFGLSAPSCTSATVENEMRKGNDMTRSAITPR